MNTHGTGTGRFRSDAPQDSNTPKEGTAPSLLDMDFSDAERRVLAHGLRTGTVEHEARPVSRDAWLALGLPSAEELARRNDEQARTIRGLRAQLGRAANVAALRGSPEVRALLKEVIDVLHCHHRNTHKPLLERVRQLRKNLT